MTKAISFLQTRTQAYLSVWKLMDFTQNIVFGKHETFCITNGPNVCRSPGKNEWKVVQLTPTKTQSIPFRNVMILDN